VTVLAACVLSSSVVFAQAVPPQKAAQPAAGAPGKALMEQVLAAWSTMNVENVRKYYDPAPGAVFYDVSPLKFAGFTAYADGVTPMFATLSSLTFALNDDVAVHPGAATTWATATVKTVMTDKAGKATPMDCRWTVVWQKKAAGWVIVHDHFSAPVVMEK
jgi:ketosteroid isomerase-like protein